jgi:hypothetical protein
MIVKNETAGLVHSVIDLLKALRANPDLAGLAEEHVRVSFDSRERLILVSSVDDVGHGHPLLAIMADPFDPTFGTAGIPEPVVGVYDPEGPTH